MSPVDNVATARPAWSVNISDALYNRLKWATQYLLPAVAVFYVSISEIWDLGHGAQVLGTIAAVEALMGVVLGLSSRAYNHDEQRFDGAVIETGDPNSPHSLEFAAPLSELTKKDEITLKVQRP